MALLDADCCAIDQSLRMTRHERECAPDADERLVETTKLQQHSAVIVVSVGRCRIELERGADEFERILAVALLLADDPEKMCRIEMLGRKLQNSGIEPFGIIEQAAAMQRDTRFHRLPDRLVLGGRNFDRLRALCR